MAQTIDNQIQKYLPLLGNSEKKSLLVVIKSFLSLKNKGYETINTEEYNKELDEAEQEYEKGDYISNEQMIAKIKKW